MNKIPVENILIPDTKQALSNGARDKQLWLEVLEKNSLYSTLDAFEVIDTKTNNANNIEANAAKENNAINAEKTKQTIDIKTAQTENNTKAGFSSLRSKQSGAHQPLTQKSNQFLKESPIGTSTASQSVSIAGMAAKKQSVKQQQAASNYMKHDLWLSKNTTVTIAHTAVEVWVRDVNLTEHKLTQALNQIKRSMAHLGVSLSKVTINGKTAFHAQKTLEVKSWQ